MKYNLINLNKVLGVLIFFLFANGNAQNVPFWNDIQVFKKQDSIAMPSRYKTLFIGSSSFTIWKTLEKDLPEYEPLNRAFGGSTLLDVIHFKNDIIDKYNPERVVIYCGENDIASSDTVTAKMVLNRFKELHSHIRKMFPAIHIYYVSMKPSPSRWSMQARMVDANKGIKKYSKKMKNTHYISIWDQMLMDGKPDPSIFMDDSLHMNKKGYDIWIKELRKQIKK